MHIPINIALNTVLKSKNLLVIFLWREKKNGENPTWQENEQPIKSARR